MYKEIIENLKIEISSLDTQIDELKEKRSIKQLGKNQIEKLQNEYEKENNNLAIQKGVCPFPNECSLINSCTKNYCHADVCSNGHVYRMS